MSLFKKHGIWILVGFFMLWFTVFSVYRHFRIHTFMFDLGYYDQVVWLASQGKSLFSTMVEAHTWTDHFSPSLFLLIPFYLISPSPLILLVTQSLLLPLGAVPIYYLSLRKTKSFAFSLAISFSYLMFWGIHNAVAFDFHPLALGAPLFAFMIYWYEKQNWGAFWITTLIFGGLQENHLIFLCIFGIFLLLRYRDILQGLLLTMISGLIFFFLIFITIPRVFHIDYSYLPSNTNFSATTFIKKAYLPHDKVELLGYSFGAFSFVPLLSPSYALLFIEEYGGRFLIGDNPNWWSFGYQYNALPAALLSLSAIEVITRYKKIAPIIAGLLVLSSVTTFVRVKPDTLRAFKADFYDLSATKDAYSVLSHVPRNASVAAANDLGAQLAEREEIYFITNCLEDNATVRDADGKPCLKVKPDYLIADLSEGANWNDFVYTFDRERVKRFFTNQILSGEYEIQTKVGEIYLLHKIGKTAQ